MVPRSAAKTLTWVRTSGQTWTVSGTVFSRLRVPVDSRRFRLAAPAGATVAAATAQHALYGIFTPDDHSTRTQGMHTAGLPSSIGLSRRCASTPRSRFRRSRSSTPRP